MYRLWSGLVLALAVLPVYAYAAETGEVYRAHAISMHGEPKYGPGFDHFDYVNPNAPKGGHVVLSTTGSFDSLHPFILKGQAAAGIGHLFETLMTESSDEAFTEYGLLAETISWPEDRSWVAFTLRPEARWHDGKPVTVEDVIWSLDILKREGHPLYRSYYANVTRAEKIDDRTVKFTFSGPSNRELPLITGQLPILPKHYWQGRTFSATTLEPPVGSGPYQVKRVDPGRSITYERDPSYWGKDLPVNRGKDNFDMMRYDYYRDGGVAREAFKAGAIDFFNENVAKDWATSYNLPVVQTGLIIKREIPNENPQGMQAFVFNTRRAIFKDRQVREAINYAFDFEWTNKNLFYGAYQRSTSFFSNSELASSGPPSDAERAVLEPFQGQLPDDVLSEPFTLPKTEGTGDIRGNLRQALRLLRQAGWEIRQGKLTHKQTGQVLRFEILLVSPSFERITLPFTQNLQRLGIDATVRTVDTAQYQQRLDTYDFDMVVNTWGQSLSPGNEQRNYWSSEAAEIQGTQNLAGIKDPVVDRLIGEIISAPDRDSLIARTRALDRVLLWSYYVVPQWHISSYRVLYWDKFGLPSVAPKYSLGFDNWWIDPDREASLAQRKGKVK